MSASKLRQAIPSQPDITTQAGLIVNTQFSEPFCVYGAYTVGMVQKEARNSRKCMKGSITMKQVQSAINPFTAHLKRALYTQS